MSVENVRGIWKHTCDACGWWWYTVTARPKCRCSACGAIGDSDGRYREDRTWAYRHVTDEDGDSTASLSGEES